MHRRFYAVWGTLVLSVPTLLWSTPAYAAGIPWTRDFAKAKAQAQRAGRPILVNFYTDWCGYCKKLDAEVFPKADVVRASAQFVPVRMNAEKEGMALARKLQVSGFPATFIMTPSGLVADQMPGFLPAENFTMALQAGLGKVKELAALEARQRANPSDTASAMKLASIASESGNRPLALAMMASVKKADPTNKGGNLSKTILAASLATQNEGKFADAVPMLQSVTKLSRERAEITLARLNLAICYQLLNKPRDAAGELQIVLGDPNMPMETRQAAQKMLDRVNKQLAGKSKG